MVSNEERQKLFGKFAFKSAPLPGNRENIVVTDNWQKENIIPVNIPQLKFISGGAKIYFHNKAAEQLSNLWKDWEKAGLLSFVLTYGGSYVPRLFGVAVKTLSTHAFGSAFDINVVWNRLETVPALVGQKGCVRELVAAANKNGFYWGGHFSRLDGMHFEVAKIL